MLELMCLLMLDLTLRIEVISVYDTLLENSGSNLERSQSTVNYKISYSEIQKYAF
jgi:hypothetical protein